MQLPVKITYRNMEPSDAVTIRIEAEALKLETFFNRITSCHVMVEAPPPPHPRGEVFHVRIELGVPGAELVVSHEPSRQATLAALNLHDQSGRRKRNEVQPEHKDLNLAIRDAFASARRQLQDYVKRLRGEVKTHLQSLPDGFDASVP
jgi:ribosome-associated translation inhibitor RaiA